MLREWLFAPLDTLFFRDGFSFDAGETGYLESVFPPHPQTMQGVVRSAVLLSHCRNITLFSCCECSSCPENGNCELPKAIGSPNSPGDLNISGPYLVKNGMRYFPTPLDLMREKDGKKRFFSLVPGDPGDAVSCDLGASIRLPANPEPSNYKAFDPAGGWIREDALLRYLAQGDLPVASQDSDSKYLSDSEWLPNKEFYEKEPKVGIARDYETHGVKTGRLYSIVPLRFREGVKIGLFVGGLDKLEVTRKSVAKFGGEGRLCGLEIGDAKDSVLLGTKAGEMPVKVGDKIKLTLLQPADVNAAWSPFETSEERKTENCWNGQIKGVGKVTFRLVSACIGKQQKIGGWDMVKKEVKPMRSYVPAGSVYFLEVVECKDKTTIPNGGEMGMQTEMGLGHYLLGRW